MVVKNLQGEHLSRAIGRVAGVVSLTFITVTIIARINPMVLIEISLFRVVKLNSPLKMPQELVLCWLIRK